MAAEKQKTAETPKKRGFSLIRWFKELGSELKKVSWPKFKDVLKKLSIVIGVTAFFLVAVMLIDIGLSELYKLLISGLS